MLLSALAFAALFLAFPQIDLHVNGWFYTSETGFVLKDNGFFDFLRTVVEILVIVLLLGSLSILIGAHVGPYRSTIGRLKRRAAFVLLVVVLGPGLLVNTLLKDQWGRARPAQVTEFGGQAQFTPPWVISDQCKRNCSFVCGDCSVGFVLLALAFVSRRPRLWWAIGLSVGGLFGFMRMGQGGHFFSDVIFSFYAIYFTAWATHAWMTRNGRAPLTQG